MGPAVGDTGIVFQQEKSFPRPAGNGCCWPRPSASTEQNIPAGSRNAVPGQRSEVCHLPGRSVPACLQTLLPAAPGGGLPPRCWGLTGGLPLLLPLARGLGGKWVHVRQEGKGQGTAPD